MNKRKALTFDEVIERLGGRAKARTKLNVSPQTLTNWKARGIPAARHYEIVSKSGGKLRTEDLVNMERSA
ncbi:MAG: YdaS family helix-turn-helix protein [Pseudomonadales bacterium]|jgi:hypothetical protein|nr:YdaS family helix-turn-helix protein [Pseudomonadales bacterium]